MNSIITIDVLTARIFSDTQTQVHFLFWHGQLTDNRQTGRQTDRQTESTGKRAHRQTVNKQRQTADSSSQRGRLMNDLSGRELGELQFFPVVQTHLHSSKASTIPDFLTLFNASLWVQSSHLLLFMDLTVRPSWIPALSALLPGVTWKRQD